MEATLFLLHCSLATLLTSCGAEKALEDAWGCYGAPTITLTQVGWVGRRRDLPTIERTRMQVKVITLQPWRRCRVLQGAAEKGGALEDA